MFEGLFGTQTPEEAQAQAEKEAQLGYPVPGLAEPSVNPIDALAGGLTAIPKGLTAAFADTGIDLFMGMAMEAAENQETLKAMFIGKKGMKSMGIDVSKDLAGQFTNLVDGMARKEIADPRLRKEGVGDIWDSSKLSDLAPTDDMYKAYPELQDRTVLPVHGETGEFDPISMLTQIGADQGIEAQTKQLVHEVQHAIQQLEGFPTGSNPGNERWARTVASLQDAIVKADNEIYDIRDALPRDRMSSPEIQALEQVQEVAMQQLRVINPSDNFDNYVRSMGEVEARDAGMRMDMSPEDRARTQPGATPDPQYQDKPYKMEHMIRGLGDN